MSSTKCAKRGSESSSRAVDCWRLLTLRRSIVCASALALITACTDDPPDYSRLSSRGLYSNISRRTTVSSALEYEPDYPLWSDGAQKRRWLILPPGKNIDTSDMAHWRFPVGTKLFKEFSLRGKLIETRLVERVANTGSVKRDFFMGTFVWLKDQSDAVLTTEGVKDALGTDHDVPEQTACIQCHRGEPSAVLGFSAVQLSRSGMIDEVADAKLLSVKPERRFLIPGNEIQSVAIGYMNANCGHCHSAEGIADVMRLRFLPSEADGPLEETELYKTTIRRQITDWKVHPDDLQQRVIPGDPEHSALLYRMLQRGTEPPASDDAMPPIATEQVHSEGVAAVEAWIATLPRDLVVPEDPSLTVREHRTPKDDEGDHATMPDPQAGRGAEEKPREEAGSAAPSGEPEKAQGGAGAKAPGHDHGNVQGNDGAGGMATARIEGGAGASGGGGEGGRAAAGSSEPAAGSGAAAAGSGGGEGGSGAAGSGVAGGPEPAAGSGAGEAGSGAAGSGAGAAGQPAAGSGGESAATGGASAAGAGAAGQAGSAAGAGSTDDDDDGHDERPH